MKYDIIIAGVGGQGQVLASRLIGAAAIASGYPARTGENIGMAQRGGSVVSNVRIGDEEQSATVPSGQADLIIGFEICETARAMKKLKPGGRVILSDLVVKPVTVSLGMQAYDREKMLEYIKKNAESLTVLDAAELAIKAGSVKAANVVMLGAAAGSGAMPLEREAFYKALEMNLPAKYLELNKTAFELGYQYAMEGAQ